ncbi:MAG: molybdopterin molybdenumtransferase MoeA [Salinibacterium sp.]|nr:MAG: molybdopterin molybdenumtransferase MoeA [Salinibacterium sp.]
MSHASVDDHAAHIAELLAPALIPRTEIVALDDALGRVTADTVHSPVDLPLFRNSQMDGFAVRAADVSAAPVTLPIAGEIAAGPAEPAPLEVGSSVRIMTGAVVPQGADAIVPVEDTTVDGDSVTILRARSAGQFVRDRGSDVREGDELVPAKVLLASRHLAALAAAGLNSVLVRARVRVAIITTGTELVTSGTMPKPGQIFDSNSVALAAAVRACGAVDVYRVHVGDNPAAMLAALSGAAAAADLIVTSGGISMGNYEVVREVLEPLGARVGHIAMQPGGPQATAMFNGVPVVCFPGNPVSTQISFEVFVATLLRAASGLPAAVLESREVTSDVTSVAGKRQFLRGRRVEPGRVDVVSGPGSHLVAGLAASDCLIVIGEELSELKAGDTVETWAL